MNGWSLRYVGRKVQYVTGRGNAFFAFDKETDATADDQRHLFVRMGVLRRGQQRRESKAADHQILTDDHLTLDAFRRMLDWNTGPIQMLRAVQSGVLHS